MASNELVARIHDFGARRLLQPLYQLSQYSRKGTRDSALAFREGLRWRSATTKWSADQRHEWVLDRLRVAVRQAAATPYYAAMFRRVGFDPKADFSFAEFAQLPALERDTARESASDMVRTTIPAAHLRRDATGGSGGTPTVVWKGPLERGWNSSGTEHFMRQIGLPAGSRIGFLWGHHLDPVARSSFRDRVHDVINNARWYDCLRLSDQILDGYDAELRRWKPAGLICYAGALAALAERILARGVSASSPRPNYPTRAFVTGAEKLHDHERANVKAAFGLPVHERYGARDTGPIGFQLSPDESLDYTVDWSNMLVEPSTDEEVASVLVTKLHADGMPMLRYRVGDLARFPRDARMGHPTLVLHEVIGREVSRLWTVDGKWMNGLAFPHMLKDFPVREFQIYQGADYRVEIRIVPTSGFDDTAKGGILDIVRSNLPGVPVSLRLVEDIPRTRANKRIPVVSDVQPPLSVPS
jgi:phenylacetate-CoA ligase